MKINIKEYLADKERMHHNHISAGPFITISRNYGCDEESVVRSLIHKLNHMDGYDVKSNPWKYIDKEIIEESAVELGIKAFDVDHRVLAHHADGMTQWLSNFTHHYTLSDKKILDKVKDIIKAYARKGNVIIVGRGGVGVTKSMEHSLHIKLTAPLDYRIKVISRVKGVSALEAEEMIKRVDRERKAWAEHLIEEPLDNNVFDMIFNMEKLSIDEITNAMVGVLKQRELVPVHA